MREVIWVGLGGFFGAAGRFLVDVGIQRILPSLAVPAGTLVVNVLGCLGIGLLMGLSIERWDPGPALRLFLFTGVLGGFTTFSALAGETLILLNRSSWAFANVGLQVFLGLGAAWVGYVLTRP